jgi:hypothetical protein
MDDPDTKTKETHGKLKRSTNVILAYLQQKMEK